VETLKHFNRPSGPSLPAFIEHSTSSPRALVIQPGQESSLGNPGEALRSVLKGNSTPRLLSQRLNPYFVEWLMGWPLGWTSTAEQGASSAEETELWRSKLHWHLSYLLGELDSSL